MNKGLKVTLFTALLIGAGYYFGTICKQINQSYELLLIPSRELLFVLLWLLLAVCALAVSAGLVVALLRPIGTVWIAFTLSALAMLLGWNLTLSNGILALVYLGAAMMYAVRVARDLNERINFSVQPISDGQGLLIVALFLVACGSLYLALDTHIKQEGFTIPEAFLALITRQMEGQIESGLPLEGFGGIAVGISEAFQRTFVELFDTLLEPYERYIPIVITASLFVSLVTVSRLLTWIPSAILRFIFIVLRATGIVKIISEQREVKRLVLS
jgi:hypothetical protein